jgi:hypothetical protein
MPNRDKIIVMNYTARLAETKDRMTMMTMMMHAMTTMKMPVA